MKDKKDYEVFPILEQRSKFFCPAKWQELYLYLNHGNSNSCNHPIPHAIPAELLDDPYVLHNTPHKLEMQQQMLDNQRPAECHMCWHIEDLGPNVVSDRILKSQVWKDDIPLLTVDPHHVPRFIEVVFDNYCNLTCSYCDSGQSSSWAAKIHREPLTLTTDYRQLYSKIHIDPGTTKKEYLDAWKIWWNEIGDQVKTLKVSGGEPLLSKNFWEFVDSIKKTTRTTLNLNSNLSVPQRTMQRLLESTKAFDKISIGASIDATGDIAEYARQGLDYKQFVQNINYWCSSSPSAFVYLQSTVNVLNIWGLTDKFDLSIELRNKYPGQVSDFYSTIVRSPEFQSIIVLPSELRMGLSARIEQWQSKNQCYLTEIERSFVNKILSYLNGTPQLLTNQNIEELHIDLVKFLRYYDKTSTKSFQEVYPPEFTDWINSIPYDKSNHNHT